MYGTFAYKIVRRNICIGVWNIVNRYVPVPICLYSFRKYLYSFSQRGRLWSPLEGASEKRLHDVCGRVRPHRLIQRLITFLACEVLPMSHDEMAEIEASDPSCVAACEPVPAPCDAAKAIRSGTAAPVVPVLKKTVRERKWRKHTILDATWEHPVRPFSGIVAERMKLTPEQILEWRTAWCAYRERMNNIREDECPFIAKHFLIDSWGDVVRENGRFITNTEWGCYTKWLHEAYNAKTTRRKLVNGLALRKMKRSEPAYKHKMQRFADRTTRENVMFGHITGDRWGNPLRLASQEIAKARDGMAKVQETERVSGVLDALREKGWDVRD